MPDDYLDRVERDNPIDPPEYEPWQLMGIPERQYWRDRYIEARKNLCAYAQALEFIRDCEDDGEEMGPIVTVSFLKEQARTILARHPA